VVTAPETKERREWMDAPSVLEVKGIHVRAGSRALLDGITFRLLSGELCALIGPSGAGKSTLIHVLLGLNRPASGTITLGGRPISQAGPLGYVPQDDALHPSLTVRRELEFAAELRLPDQKEDERRARLESLYKHIGLDRHLDTKIRKLSGGQRKRVSVAMELLTRPDLLILDEPTSGLDPGLERQSMTLFSRVARSGRIVVVATHAMESLDLCAKLVVLVGGHLAFFGAPRDALRFFRVDRYASLFDQLGKQSPEGWARTFAREYGDGLAETPGSAMMDHESIRGEAAMDSEPRHRAFEGEEENVSSALPAPDDSPSEGRHSDPAGKKRIYLEELAELKAQRARARTKDE